MPGGLRRVPPGDYEQGAFDRPARTPVPGRLFLGQVSCSIGLFGL
jgi:hypothetical protein